MKHILNLKDVIKMNDNLGKFKEIAIVLKANGELFEYAEGTLGHSHCEIDSLRLLLTHIEKKTNWIIIHTHPFGIFGVSDEDHTTFKAIAKGIHPYHLYAFIFCGKSITKYVYCHPNWKLVGFLE